MLVYAELFFFFLSSSLSSSSSSAWISNLIVVRSGDGRHHHCSSSGHHECYNQLSGWDIWLVDQLITRSDCHSNLITTNAIKEKKKQTSPRRTQAFFSSPLNCWNSVFFAEFEEVVPHHIQISTGRLPKTPHRSHLTPVLAALRRPLITVRSEL